MSIDGRQQLSIDNVIGPCRGQPKNIYTGPNSSPCQNLKQLMSTALADLEAPKRVRVIGLWPGWPRPTCKVENEN